MSDDDDERTPVADRARAVIQLEAVSARLDDQVGDAERNAREATRTLASRADRRDDLERLADYWHTACTATQKFVELAGEFTGDHPVDREIRMMRTWLSGPATTFVGAAVRCRSWIEGHAPAVTDASNQVIRTQAQLRDARALASEARLAAAEAGQHELLEGLDRATIVELASARGIKQAAEAGVSTLHAGDATHAVRRLAQVVASDLENLTTTGRVGGAEDPAVTVARLRRAAEFVGATTTAADVFRRAADVIEADR